MIESLIYLLVPLGMLAIGYFVLLFRLHRGKAVAAEGDDVSACPKLRVGEGFGAGGQRDLEAIGPSPRIRDADKNRSTAGSDHVGGEHAVEPHGEGEREQLRPRRNLDLHLHPDLPPPARTSPKWWATMM